MNCNLQKYFLNYANAELNVLLGALDICFKVYPNKLNSVQIRFILELIQHFHLKKKKLTKIYVKLA